MKALALASALVTAAAGCGGVFPDATSAYADADDPALAAALHAAIDRVVAATGVDVVYGRGHGAARFRRGRPDHAGRAGEWNRVTRTATVSPAVVDPEALETVVLHELGHALGAGHVAPGAGVMAPRVGGPVGLSAADLEELCSQNETCTRFVPETAP